MFQHRARAAALVIALCSGPILGGCATVQRFRGMLAAPRTPAPDRIEVDLYVDYAESPAMPLGRIETPQAAADAALARPMLLEHLRDVDMRYAGRRNPRLSWSALVERVPPLDAQNRGSARQSSEDPYWRVRVVSSDVRDSSVYYSCELRVSLAGGDLTSTKPPAELCGWQRPPSPPKSFGY